MAKQVEGFLGGFRGKLGPVVGYCWNGKWVMRSRPRVVNNPRTEAQQAHREEFRGQVQLAAAMRQGVVAGMTVAARQAGITAYNLFVSLNQGCFGDYRRLRVAAGPLAPVGFTFMSYDGAGRLEVGFEKNPLHMRADRYDEVRLYLYNADLRQGYLTSPVYRAAGRIGVVVPEWLTDEGSVYVYGFVRDAQRRCSESAFVGVLGEEQEEVDEEQRSPAPNSVEEAHDVSAHVVDNNNNTCVSPDPPFA